MRCLLALTLLLFPLPAAPAQEAESKLTLLLEAEELYWNGSYQDCLEKLDAQWREHPPGGEDWARLQNPRRDRFLGTPPAYYALRMLTDCARWRTEQGELPASSPAVLTVVLVGRSRGLEPRDRAELDAGKGIELAHRLEPALLTDDHRLVHQSLRLFREHVLAMTRGRLRVETRVVHLPDLELPVQVSYSGRIFAGLAAGGLEQVWAALPTEVRAGTDWWWVLYPSNVPERYPDFAAAEVVTGGMATGPDGASPCFLVDDRWLTRKPPHLGEGFYSDEERRAYLPQWLQHEFFHHLFRSWPEFGLEAKSHGWFDRSSWPEDFEGRFEPDYFHEALFQRLRPLADPPLHVGLRYAPPAAELYTGLALEDLLGSYHHEPFQNDWHAGEIERAGETQDGAPLLRWTNRAGVSWELRPDLAAGLLRSGADNPYFQALSPEASAFRIALERGENGGYLPRIAGFRFQGGLYRRVGG